ncbi:ParB/RepB/Spo0J family partition protein [Fusibacter sp. JL298sf-3]
MAVKKSGLGRGLGALIPTEKAQKIEMNINAQGELIQEIDIDLIVPNKNQPRTSFDAEAIAALADSIEQHGLIQPIIVKPNKGTFQIIAGERRWRASKQVGKSKISAIIKDVDAFTIAQLALIENLQREDLSAIEEAHAYEQLISNYHLTQEQLSKIVGKSRSHLTNTLRLLKLDKSMQEAIASGAISHGHGRALLSIDDEKLRQRLFDMMIEEGLSVRKSEEIAKEGFKSSVKKVPRLEKQKEVVAIENELSSTFGTKVKIKEKSGKGKITIDFYSVDDLNRILEFIQRG